MLGRLALRIAALEALAPTACFAPSGPAFPTLAGAFVFDSRLDPIEDKLEYGTARPVICIYTDEDEGRSAQTRGPPFNMTVDICFEVSVVVKVSNPQTPGAYIVGFPDCDAALEASLDCMAAQVYFILCYGPTGTIFRDKLTKNKIHSPRTVAHRDSEEGVRIARRSITWKVEIPSDTYTADAQTAPTGFARLPHPLREVAFALPAESYGQRLLTGLLNESTFPAMPLVAAFGAVGLNVKVAAPNGNMPAAPNIVGVADGIDTGAAQSNANPQGVP